MTSDKEIWSLPSPSHIMACIEKWRSLDLRKRTDSEIDIELSSLLDSLETYMVSSVQTNFSNYGELGNLNINLKLTHSIVLMLRPLCISSLMCFCSSENAPKMKRLIPFALILSFAGKYVSWSNLTSSSS